MTFWAGLVGLVFFFFYESDAFACQHYVMGLLIMVEYYQSITLTQSYPPSLSIPWFSYISLPLSLSIILYYSFPPILSSLFSIWFLFFNATLSYLFIYFQF